MDIDKTRVQEIVRLHSEVANHLKQTLEKAIKIGLLLTEQKQVLRHGEFTPWLEANIPFTDRTARNYMRLYRERDKLKTETVSGLKTAYALLAPPQEEYLDCFDADTWGKIIESVNTEFFHDLDKFRIDTEPGKMGEFLEERDDGSLNEGEKKGFALWINFQSHLCYWINFAKAKGKDKLPPQIRKYIDSIMEDKPNWINEPFKMCKDRCRQKF